MNLLQCPRCKNKINPQSTVCPVCGCRPKTESRKTIAKWVIVALCSVYFANRYVLKLSFPHHSPPLNEQAMVQNKPTR